MAFQPHQRHEGGTAMVFFSVNNPWDWWNRLAQSGAAVVCPERNDLAIS
jgi:hypothetical protein